MNQPYVSHGLSLDFQEQLIERLVSGVLHEYVLSVVRLWTGEIDSENSPEKTVQQIETRLLSKNGLESHQKFEQKKEKIEKIFHCICAQFFHLLKLADQILP